MKKILLLYVSRSFSTLFMRIMMNAGAHVYHDRMGAAIRYPTDDFTPDKVTDFYIAQAISNAANGQHTFVKESCWVFEKHEQCLKRLVGEHGFVPVYLVRDPKDAVKSYLRMEQQVGDKEKWSAARSIRHDLLYQFYRKYAGPLIVAEDFVSSPAPTMRRVLAELDMSFDEAILKLDPLNVNVLEESRILRNYRQFYEDALKSDRIIDKTASWAEVEFTDADLVDIVARNAPYYQLFLAEKQRLLAGARPPLSG